MKNLQRYVAICCIFLFTLSLVNHVVSAKIEPTKEVSNDDNTDKKEVIQLRTSDFSFQFVQFWIGRTSHILFTIDFYSKRSAQTTRSYNQFFSLKYYIQLFKNIIVKNAP